MPKNCQASLRWLVYSTIIGNAGRSGNMSNTYWPTSHLHQGIYVNASLVASSGGIYAGQSVQPLNVTFIGSGGGHYTTFTQYQVVSY